MSILIDFATLIFIYFIIFFEKWKKKDRKNFLAKTLMYIYISSVICVTLMPVIASIPTIFTHPHQNINLIPFIDVLKGRGDYIRQIILNIALTIPFGFLLPTTNKNISFSKVLLSTLFLSFSIEALQFILSSTRTPDITDVITNFIGGAFGYCIYKLTIPVTTKFLNKIKAGCNR